MVHNLLFTILPPLNNHLKYYVSWVKLQENVIKIYLDFTKSIGK